MALTILGCATDKHEPMTIEYPETFKDTTVKDDYHGTIVADPFRWLEDDLSEETADWVARQNEVTSAFLDNIPFRQDLRDRFEELWDYEKVSAPFKRGDYIYFYKNDGLQDQFVIYRQKEDDDEAEVFLDPNSFSEDGTTSLATISFTKDGSLVAYAISEGGSDWRKIIIMNAEDKTIMEDTLVDIKFSGISWYKNEGFYYSSYDRPEGSELSAMTDRHKLFYHRLGTPQSEDELVFGGDMTPRRYIGGGVSEDMNYLVISAQISTTGNELYIKDLNKPNAPIEQIIDNFDNTHSVLDIEGSTMYIVTNLDAPNRKIVTADVSNPRPDAWEIMIDETDMPLTATTAGGYIFASYLKDATTQVLQYNMSGELVREISLPAIGTASGFSGKKDDDELYFNFTNYVFPGTIFKLDIESGKSELYRSPDVDFNPEDFVSEQFFYTSEDGTEVPIIITHKKGLKRNGNNPTILYGYGGFNVSLTPSFSIATVPFLEQGGIYAVANLRGGGEYGKAWHDGGRKMKKQNVFDDFIAAAEYLISENYTSPEKLAIRGGSNGGLLVGACMAQRPDLFQVALPAVGVLDMLRYHRFTAGAGWAYDYGTADDSQEMFEYLYGYSPLHNLVDGTDYPATLITTADHDDRVVPAHSFKFAARLQEATTGDRPALIRIETKAGHGAGKPTSMIIDEQTDIYAFVLYNMGIRKLK